MLRTAPPLVVRGDAAAGATFSPCATYRYRLWRTWDPARPPATFLMLNPSTATERVLDPTLRRCADYAKRWGFGGFEVLNLFALRSTDPRALAVHDDPVGPANDAVIAERGRASGALVVGWGAHAMAVARARAVCEVLTGVPLVCLGTTKSGAPRHPLYLRKGAPRRPWRIAQFVATQCGKVQRPTS